MSELAQSIRERYLQTLDKITRAAQAAGRAPDSVRLVVVTKSQPLEVVEAAVQAGVKILGENYPEEGVMKLQSLPDGSAVEWHMIGHVQSRKAQLVARHFNLMHSLDSVKLANRLDRFSAEAGRVLPVLLEFNLGGEQSKTGWPAWDEGRWGELEAGLEEVLALPHLKVMGLMAMPPLGEAAESSRPYFQRMRRLRDFLLSKFPQSDLRELSMGTSADYEVAVQEEATLVRVGTAIVGPRPYQLEA
jgi:pyridoxal phosphate enzyme (YggS family)